MKHRQSHPGASAIIGLCALAAMLGLCGGGCSTKPEPPPRPKASEEAGRLSRQAAQLQANGEWVGALAWWERAAQQFQLLNDRTNLAMAWHNQGVVRRALGRTEDALADLDRAAGLNAELGQTNAWWRNQIARLQVANDARLPEVGEWLGRLDENPGRPMEGRLSAILSQERARAWLEMGRLPEALGEAERAVFGFGMTGDRAGKAAATVTRAKILRRMGRWSESGQLWQEVLKEFEALGDAGGVAVALAGWGGCLAAERKDLETAGDLLRRAEENYRLLGRVGEAEAVAAERASLSP